MNYMSEKNKTNEAAEIFSKYAVNALNKLGYSEKDIREFLLELENQIKINNNPDKLSEDDMRQIIFEEIEIPVKYNLIKIRELFEQHEFMKAENRYIAQRICNAFERKRIVYIKDLYGKTKKDITDIKSIGEVSYEFFIHALTKIFSE